MDNIDEQTACETKHPKFKGMEEQKVSDPDLSLWEGNPPVAEISLKEPNNNAGPKERDSRNIQYCLSVSAAAFFLFLVWFLFLLPQLCFFRVGICVLQVEPLEEELNTSTLVINCSANPYTGTQCLNHFGSCVNPLVNIRRNKSLEEELSFLFYILDTQSLDSSCEKEKQTIKEFVCIYSYQPCDLNTHIVLPSRNVCEYLRDTACPTEWSILLSGQYASLLPSCEQLHYRNSSNFSCIFSNVSSDSSENTDTLETDINTSNNSVEGSCANVKYEGTHCLNYLDSCLVDSYTTNSDTLIGVVVGQIDTLANDQSCINSKELVVEFLCQSIFPRCDLNDFVHLPNKSHCEYIRDELCPNDWPLVQLLTNDQLPNCSTLSAISTNPVCQDIVNSANLSEQHNFSIICNEHDGFFHYVEYGNHSSSINNTCQARCSKWNLFQTSTLRVLDDVIVLMSAIVGIIGTIAVVICSVIRKERMLIFPSIFLIYGVLHVFEIALLIVIQFTSRSSLSCSSDDLLTTTVTNPSIFCSISGFALLHSFLGLGYWWFAHICIIFWKIMFPFHAKSHEEKSKHIHAVVGVFGLLLPLIPPSLIFIWDGYAVNRFPPVLCLPVNVDALYYSVLLPLSLIITLGITQLIFVFHAIRQKSRLFHYRISKTHSLGLSTAEKKLLVVFVYYLIFGYVDIIGFAYSVSSLEEVARYIEETLMCEAFRVDLEFTCPKQYLEARISSTVALLTYIFLGVYPLVNLVFAVNKSELQVKFVTWFPSFFTESFRASTLSSSIVGTPGTPFTMRRRLTYNFSTTDHIKTSNETATVGKSGFYLKKFSSTASVENTTETSQTV